MLATLVAPGLPSQSLACHEEAQQKSSEMRLLLLTALTQVVKMRDDLRKVRHECCENADVDS